MHACTKSSFSCCTGKGDNKLGKLLERVRADALAGKDTDVWCAMRFQLALPLDAMVNFVVSKAGQIVAEPSFEGKPIIRMGERPWMGEIRERTGRRARAKLVFFFYQSCSQKFPDKVGNV